MFTTTSVSIDTDSDDKSGLLVFSDNLLVAVLVCLEDSMHAHEKGRWHFEALFRNLPKPKQTYTTSTEALAWLAENLTRRT